MGRPREHDLDAVLDAARHLWVADGVTALTTRALAAEAGVSNGAIYHAFGSRDGVLAAVWARDAGRFLAHQSGCVADALRAGGSAVDAVVAAATAPAGYARTDSEGARLLLSATGEELVRGDLRDTQRTELAGLRRTLGRLVADLARRLWERDDPAALAVVRACLVELPTAMLLRPAPSAHGPSPWDDDLACAVLERAVRGVLLEEPPG